MVSYFFVSLFSFLMFLFRCFRFWFCICFCFVVLDSYVFGWGFVSGVFISLLLCFVLFCFIAPKDPVLPSCYASVSVLIPCTSSYKNGAVVVNSSMNTANSHALSFQPLRLFTWSWMDASMVRTEVLWSGQAAVEPWVGVDFPVFQARF